MVVLNKRRPPPPPIKEEWLVLAAVLLIKVVFPARSTVEFSAYIAPPPQKSAAHARFRNLFYPRKVMVLDITAIPPPGINIIC